MKVSTTLLRCFADSIGRGSTRIIDDVGVADWYQLRLEYLGRIDPTLDIEIF